jgi:hypothetical protein
VRNHLTNAQRRRRYLVFVRLVGVFGWSADAVCSCFVPALGATPTPKISVRLGRSMPAQILWDSIDTYPRRPSGHQVLENGRSGYADEEDHE